MKIIPTIICIVLLLAFLFCIFIILFCEYAIYKINKKRKILDEYFAKYHDMKFLMVFDPLFYYDDEFIVEFYTKCCSLYKKKFTKEEIDDAVEAERTERDANVLLMFLHKCSENKLIINLSFYSDEFREMYEDALADFRFTQEFINGILKEVEIDE